MKQNLQAPTRVVKESSSVLVHSIFNTIQGEGPFSGQRAIFVRLAGCNLQCPMCDTEYTNGAMPYTPQTLLDEILNLTYPVPDLIVLTGGEPLRQPIGPYVAILLFAGFRVQVETNGTLYRDDLPYGHARFTVVCSPKTHFVHEQLLPHVAALKYVATAESLDPADGLPLHALGHPTKGKLFRPPVDFKGEVYLQPVDEQADYLNTRNQRAVVASCMKHGYRLCLQLHKIIGVA